MSCQRLVFLLPGVLVGEFVDEHHLRVAPQHRLDVELGEVAAPVRDELRRDYLDAFEQFGGLLAAVGLDDGGDHVGAPLETPVRLAEHRVRLADAGCCAQVDAQLPAFRLVR